MLNHTRHPRHDHTHARIDAAPLRSAGLASLVLGLLLACGPAEDGDAPDPLELDDPLELSEDASLSSPRLPGQFVAKQYTEGLGRAPDAGGWTSAAAFFDGCGCTAACLEQWGTALWTSPELEGLGYRPEELVLALYRGVLNREPDAAGHAWWTAQLQGGMRRADLARAFFRSSEFLASVANICGQPSYGFGRSSAIPIGAVGPGFAGGTGAQLQALLDAARPGTTVWLAQASLTTLTAPLVVPAGVTLATSGTLTRYQYAKQGRLVRSSRFDGPVVELRSGAQLRSVWISGQRGHLEYLAGDRPKNIHAAGGRGLSITKSRISDTIGWSSVQIRGSLDRAPCASAVIRDNLITTYSSDHQDGTWADGLSIGCEDALIEGNHIIDPTDVGIVVFTAHPAVQRSVVRGNIVVHAGNSAFGSLAFDPLHRGGSFVGARIVGNTVWSSPSAHSDHALVVGTRAWFGARSLEGRGGELSDNGTGGLRIRANNGILVDGMLDAIVQRNVLTTDLVAISHCPSAHVLADVSGGHASGSLQAFTDARADGCVGHR